MMNNNYKIWVSGVSDINFIIADGFSGNPFALNQSLTNNFYSLQLQSDTKIQVGDPFYNINYGGVAFLFAIGQDTGAYATVSYGQTKIFTAWKEYIIIIAGCLFFIAVAFIACCFVRRLSKSKSSSSSTRVKKYSDSTSEREDKLNKYKYNKNGARVDTLSNRGG